MYSSPIQRKKINKKLNFYKISEVKTTYRVKLALVSSSEDSSPKSDAGMAQILEKEHNSLGMHRYKVNTQTKSSARQEHCYTSHPSASSSLTKILKEYKST